MTVLTIIAILVIALAIYFIVKSMNNYTYEKFSYQFFDESSMFMISIGYLAVFFGNELYKSALSSTNGDTLNGAIIIGIGIFLLLIQVLINFKSTNFIFGLFGTIIQFVLLVPITVVGLFALFFAMAFFAESRPVYNIN